MLGAVSDKYEGLQLHCLNIAYIMVYNYPLLVKCSLKNDQTYQSLWTLTISWSLHTVFIIRAAGVGGAIMPYRLTILVLCRCSIQTCIL